MRTIFARPYACKQTTILVENANPIQIRKQIWRWVDECTESQQNKKALQVECFRFVGELTPTLIEKSAIHQYRLSYEFSCNTVC